MIPTIAPELVEFEGGFKDTPEWGSTVCHQPLVHLPMVWRYAPDRNLLSGYATLHRLPFLEADNHIIAYGLGDWFDIGPEVRENRN